MKEKLNKILLALVVAAGLFAFAGSAEAGCRWIGGHYGPYGGWVPGHRVCWGGGFYGPVYRPYYRYHGCRWIPGHYGPYGYWQRGHRACW